MIQLTILRIKKKYPLGLNSLMCINNLCRSKYHGRKFRQQPQIKTDLIYFTTTSKYIYLKRYFTIPKGTLT